MQADAAGPDRTFGRRMLIYVAFIFAAVVIAIFAYRAGYGRGFDAGKKLVPQAAVTQPLGTCIQADTVIYKTGITYDECRINCGAGCTWTTAVPRDTTDTLKTQ